MRLRRIAGRTASRPNREAGLDRACPPLHRGFRPALRARPTCRGNRAPTSQQTHDRVGAERRSAASPVFGERGRSEKV